MHYIFTASILSLVRNLLAASAHVAQSSTPSNLVAQWAEAGPGPGAVSAAFLAIYSEALFWLGLARRRPCTWPVTWRTSHSNVCKLKESKIISLTMPTKYCLKYGA